MQDRRRRCRACRGRRAAARACARAGRARTSAKVAVSGRATILVRGTMMSRTVLSPNSSTLWSSRFSSRWITPSSAPRLKTLLSSSSVRPGRRSGDAQSAQRPVGQSDAERRRGARGPASSRRAARRTARDTATGRRRADRLGRHLGEDEEGDRREENRDQDAVARAEPAVRPGSWPRPRPRRGRGSGRSG